MMQNILFPMKVMKITTRAGEGSHVGSNAIDIAGSDSGIESAFAPFTGIIRKIWSNGNTVWLESAEPVLFADGRQDFAVVSLTHDNSIGDLAIGRRIEQGQNFYQEGTAGKATGNHIHLEIGAGRFSGAGWHQIANGNWVINNSYPAQAAFFLKDTIVLDGGGYQWKLITEEKDMLDIDETRAAFRAFRLRDPVEGELNTYANKMPAGELIRILDAGEERHAAAKRVEIGTIAINDGWENQIYELQKECDSLKAELAAALKVGEKAVPVDYTKLTGGELIEAGINKLIERSKETV